MGAGGSCVILGGPPPSCSGRNAAKSLCAVLGVSLPRRSGCHQLPSCAARKPIHPSLAALPAKCLPPSRMGACRHRQKDFWSGKSVGERKELRGRSAPSSLSPSRRYSSPLCTFLSPPARVPAQSRHASGVGRVSSLSTPALAPSHAKVEGEGDRLEPQEPVVRRGGPHVFPAEDGVAGGAVDVGHGVHTRDEEALLLGAPRHVHPAPPPAATPHDHSNDCTSRQCALQLCAVWAPPPSSRPPAPKAGLTAAPCRCRSTGPPSVTVGEDVPDEFWERRSAKLPILWQEGDGRVALRRHSHIAEEVRSSVPPLKRLQHCSLQSAPLPDAFQHRPHGSFWRL